MKSQTSVFKHAMVVWKDKMKHLWAECVCVHACVCLVTNLQYTVYMSCFNWISLGIDPEEKEGSEETRDT